jgi:hypothetical protein
MMGRLNHDQGQLFYSFRLEEAVPDDHLARKIAAVLDLSWVYAEAIGCTLNLIFKIAPRSALHAVSTGRQAEHDLSIPDQRSQLKLWCRANGHDGCGVCRKLARLPATIGGRASSR